MSEQPKIAIVEITRCRLRDLGYWLVNQAGHLDEDEIIVKFREAKEIHISIVKDKEEFDAT